MAPPEQVQLKIVTQSQEMSLNTPPQPPVITMNGAPIPTPAQPPGTPTGYQIVILNAAKDYTDPSSILANTYISLYGENGGNLWGSTYQYLYSGLLFTQLSAGNVEQQLVIIASFGLDANMPPSNDGYQMFLRLGAGPQLQGWETGADAGSQGGSGWVSYPANYILVGFSANGYNNGYEIYQVASGNEVTTTLAVTLINPGGSSAS